MSGAAAAAGGIIGAGLGFGTGAGAPGAIAGGVGGVNAGSTIGGGHGGGGSAPVIAAPIIGPQTPQSEDLTKAGISQNRRKSFLDIARQRPGSAQTLLTRNISRNLSNAETANLSGLLGRSSFLTGKSQ